MIRSFKFRLLPNKRQHADLRAILESQRVLYNAALSERIDAWRRAKVSINYHAQSKSLTECRAALPDMAALPPTLQRETLKRLDRAMQAFFRRVKCGENPGFPRFKGADWFDSFGFCEWKGVRFVNGRIRFSGCSGGLRIHTHRALPDGKPLCAQLRRDACGWSITLQYHVPEEPLAHADVSVGIDLGISTFAALSTGEMIPSPRHARRLHSELRKRQRALSRCKMGSNSRRKARRCAARAYKRIADARRTHHHQTASDLVRRFGLIAIEDLNIKGLAAGFLAREVADAGWALFIKILRDKAESAGRAVVAVDAKRTSQTCPTCGNVKPKTLAERTHRCDCGCLMDRDVAAAKVILQRAVVSPCLANPLNAAA